MTLQEISRYYNLRQQLIKFNTALLELRTKAENCTANFDGMPSDGSHSNKVAIYGGLIAQLERDIERENEELRLAKEATLDFIADIEDTYLRTIFYLRFIICLSWFDVADEIGFRGPINSLRMMCYRYLDSTESS